MDRFYAIALLRQYAVQQGHIKVLCAIDSAEQDEVMKTLVRQDPGSSEVSSALPHVFSLEPVVFPSVLSAITTISDELASKVREKFVGRFNKIPSTHHLMVDNNAEYR